MPLGPRSEFSTADTWLLFTSRVLSLITLRSFLGFLPDILTINAGIVRLSALRMTGQAKDCSGEEGNPHLRPQGRRG